MNLTAIQEANTGSVTLYWLAPTHSGEEVTSYDVRFKACDEAHYTPLTPVGVDPLQNYSDLYQFSVTVAQSDGLLPLTRCDFEVRARVHATAGSWCKVVRFVGMLPHLMQYTLFISIIFLTVFQSGPVVSPGVSQVDSVSHILTYTHFAVVTMQNSVVSTYIRVQYVTHSTVHITEYS